MVRRSPWHGMPILNRAWPATIYTTARPAAIIQTASMWAMSQSTRSRGLTTVALIILLPPLMMKMTMKAPIRRNWSTPAVTTKPQSIAEIIGTWSSGIWYRDVAASKWTQMNSHTPDGDIAVGDFIGDGKADVASCWDSGLWYQNGANLDWTKVTNTAPYNVTAGDVTKN